MNEVSVLVASTCREDAAWFEVVLGEAGWQFHCAHRIEDAVAFIRKRGTIVLVAEPGLPAGNWKAMLARLIEEGHPSALVVVSHEADERLWSQVLRLGGLEGLPKPFRDDDTTRTLALAWQQCKQVCGGAGANGGT